MIYFELLCVVFMLALKDEALAWMILVVMILPPILRIGFEWSDTIRKEDGKYRPSIDEDGFYD